MGIITDPSIFNLSCPNVSVILSLGPQKYIAFEKVNFRFLLLVDCRTNNSA